MLEAISKLDQEYIDSLDFDPSELSDDELAILMSSECYEENYFQGIKVCQEYIKRGLYESNR